MLDSSDFLINNVSILHNKEQKILDTSLKNVGWCLTMSVCPNFDRMLKYFFDIEIHTPRFPGGICFDLFSGVMPVLL